MSDPPRNFFDRASRSCSPLGMSNFLGCLAPKDAAAPRNKTAEPSRTASTSAGGNSNVGMQTPSKKRRQGTFPTRVLVDQLKPVSGN